MKYSIVVRGKYMNVLNFEVCVKSDIDDEPGGISHEMKANRLKQLKYLNVGFLSRSP
jgi:hypothetical protein